MKYKILDTIRANELYKNYNLNKLSATFLASFSNEIIDDFLSYKTYDIEFDYMHEAIEIINNAIDNNLKIVIIGDYDCDGILATSILVKCFAKINIKVGYYIPDRLSDGYGLNIDLVKMFKEKDYHLIISVDNGIKAKDAIEYAKSIGMEVIISDHHQIEEELLDDDTIYIHPSFSNLDYQVSGGFVAYQIAKNIIGDDDIYLKVLAAITLLSDVMPICKGNRVFIKKALQELNKHKFIQICQLSSKTLIDSGELNSTIIPKINAMGRLSDLYNPNKLVQYFCSNNIKSIINFSLEIEECNNIRKQLSNDYYIKYKDVLFDNNLIYIKDDTIHEGIIGLVASKLCNKNGVPVIIATKNNKEYKASIRSVANLNIYDIVIKYAHLLEKYGGHAQAMGISFLEENEEEFIANIKKHLSNLNLETKDYEVVKIDPSYLEVNNVLGLLNLEPFGNGFKKPNILIKDCLIKNIKTFKGNIHHRIRVIKDNYQLDLMLFNKNDIDIEINQYYDFIININHSEYKNKKDISIIIVDYDKK